MHEGTSSFSARKQIKHVQKYVYIARTIREKAEKGVWKQIIKDL